MSAASNGESSEAIRASGGRRGRETPDGSTAKPVSFKRKPRRRSRPDTPASGLQAELKQKVPFVSPEQEAYLALARTADALQSSVESKFKEFGLTGTQYNALRILRGAGAEGLPCSEIGERMITRDPDITRLLNRLEKAGLATRGHAKADRRVILGRITPAGLKLLREMDQPVKDYVHALLGHVTATDLRRLIGLLDRVRSAESSLRSVRKRPNDRGLESQ